MPDPVDAAVPARARRWAQDGYWRFQAILRSLTGSGLDERRFRTRSLEDVRTGLSNISLRHRPWLIDILLEDRPASLLEIGCGWGPNLQLLARQAPDAALTGIDISPASIAEGRSQLDAAHLGAISLLEGRADDLPLPAGFTADTVFTDAALLYVGPDRIRRTIQHMLRVARRRLVLLEMHESGAGASGRYTRDGWIRDYEMLVRPLLSSEREPRVITLPAGLFPSGRWPRYGTLIDCALGERPAS